LQEYLENANAKGLKSINTDIEIELSVYLKLFLLLYADDTILLAESREDLQLFLNTFSEYCLEWKLAGPYTTGPYTKIVTGCADKDK
jgi:hypothetical protein